MDSLKVAVEALERLLNVVDERVEIPNLLLAFQVRGEPSVRSKRHEIVKLQF